MIDGPTRAFAEALAEALEEQAVNLLDLGEQNTKQWRKECQIRAGALRDVAAAVRRAIG